MHNIQQPGKGRPGLLRASVGKHHSPTLGCHGLREGMHADACILMCGAMCAAVMGSQVTSSFFSSLKEAGANLLPDIWGKGGSPAASSASQESDHGIGDMGIDSEQRVRPRMPFAQLHA